MEEADSIDIYDDISEIRYNKLTDKLNDNVHFIHLTKKAQTAFKNIARVLSKIKFIDCNCHCDQQQNTFHIELNLDETTYLNMIICVDHAYSFLNDFLVSFSVFKHGLLVTANVLNVNIMLNLLKTLECPHFDFNNSIDI